MNTKRSIEQLAIFGGPPAFDRTLHVGCPNMGDRRRLHSSFDEVFDRRWLTNNGPCVQELERKLAAFAGTRHCIATSNATIALQLAIRALGLSGEVIVPAFTFIATAHALQWQNVTPVFCDCDPLTHNIDPVEVEKLITPRTTGIVGVHLWGRPCDVKALETIARAHHLNLVFDAAHAFGCSHRGTMIGNFGDAEVFSFHATKFFNTCEGGAVMTNDDALAERIRLMRNFGFSGTDEVSCLGINGKMSEVSAAVGLANFEAVREFICTNYQNYESYSEGLSAIPGIRLVAFDPAEKCNYQYVVLEIDPGVTRVSRDQLAQVLLAENICARRYFYPGCHRMQPYRSYQRNAGLRLPVTDRLSSRVLALPTGTAVGNEEIAGICNLVQMVVANADALCERFKETHSDLEVIA